MPRSNQRPPQLEQGRARRLLDEFANDRLVLGELRLAMAAEIRRLETSRRMKTPHQLDDETHVDAELPSRFVTRTSPLDRANDALAKIGGHARIEFLRARMLPLPVEPSEHEN
jgi:hypothetical protein